MQKQSHLRFNILLLTLLTITTLQQQCTYYSNSQDLLQSGSYVLTNTKLNTPQAREHRYQFNLNFQVPSGSALQVAASASQFAATAGNGMDFSIWGGQGPSVGTGLIVVLIDEDNSWTSIRISFLASARSDFFLGTFSASTYFAQITSSGNEISVAYPLSNWVVTQSSYYYIVELSGIHTSATSLSVILVNATFNSTSGLLKVALNINSSPAIESIVISYVVFDAATPIKFAQINSNTPSNAPYQFFGIDELRSGSSKVVGYGFSSQPLSGVTCKGAKCPANCLAISSCTSLGGVINLSQTCYLCGANQIFANGECITPTACGENMYFNGNACICNPNYIMVNNVCYITCGPNAVVINSQCQCIPGFAYSNSANLCVNSTVTCGANFVPNSNGQCICPAPFGRIGQRCLTCSANSVINSTGFCNCNSGYQLNSNTLTCDRTCQQNAVANAKNQCECVSGYYLFNNTCVLQPTCINGTIFNGQHCVCPTGQVKHSSTGQCTACTKAGQQIANNTCVCSNTYRPTQQGCVPCPDNSQYDSAKNECVCNTGFFLSKSACIKNCGDNSSWDGSACVCNSGFFLSSFTCIKNCPQNTTWNGSTCVCADGFNLVGSSCRKCEANSSYDLSTKACICVDGFFGTEGNCQKCHSSCKTCSGASASQCSTCANGSAVSGVCQPLCQVGFFVNPSGLCTACIPNCNICYTASTCTTCASGYTPNSVNNEGNIITSCAANPSGTTSTITLRGSVFAGKMIYQGLAMSLMPTGILATGCGICDNLFQIDINSQFTGITATQTFIKNSLYWFVITFNFPTATFVPTFEFTVRINPLHATYFTAQDMAQILQGAFSQSSFPSITPTIINGAGANNSTIPRSPSIPRSGPLGGSAQGTSSSTGIDQTTINQLFAK